MLWGQASVTNVRAAQRAGTKLVDITYDLAGTRPPFTVSLRVSSDDGKSFNIPAKSLSGAIGAGISAGTNKQITWNAAVDWNQQYSASMRYELSVTDQEIVQPPPPAPEGFALIPAGSVQMGDSFNEGWPGERPVQTVNLSGFYMAKHEVTKALWDEVRTWGSGNGYTDLPSGAGKAASHPVESVDWYSIVKWCNARSERDGFTPAYTVGGSVYRTGKSDAVSCNWKVNGYRLPTEAEWEKAARGGLNGKRYPLGDTISHAQANYRSWGTAFGDLSAGAGYHPSYSTGAWPFTSPVGSFAANGYGLFDMAGNVFEWCWDRYGPYSATTKTDPVGPLVGNDRAFRGGVWYGSDEGSCRVSHRGHDPTGTNNGDGYSIGFRPARSIVFNGEDPQPVITGFSLIPAGSFTMGRTSGDTDSNAPPVTVNVSAFYMGKYEVTKALWDEVRTWGAVNGYTDLGVGGGKAADHPVHTISWYDMVKWCNARSQKDGLTPVYLVGGAVMKTGTTAPVANWSANGYRLPTEAEWEKAARGGVSGKRFPWGTDTISQSQANYRVYSSNRATNHYSFDVTPRPPANGTNFYHPSYNFGTSPSSPVGSFAANGYGLYDMAGNAWEYCWDWYGAYVNGATDPRGPTSGSSRVNRGGGCFHEASGCRAAYRNNNTPTETSPSFGFRLARSSAPKK